MESSSPFLRRTRIEIIVGWIQTISSALAIVAHLNIFLTLIATDVDVDQILWAFQSPLVVGVAAYVIGFAGGLYLLLGLIGQRARCRRNVYPMEIKVNQILWLFQNTRIIVIVTYIVSLFGGFVLLDGADGIQGSRRDTIFFWMIVQSIFLFLSAIILIALQVQHVYNHHYGYEICLRIFSVLCNILFPWIVNLHWNKLIISRV